MNLIKKPNPYPVYRDGELFWIEPKTNGGFRQRRAVSGGATAPTPQSQASAAQASLNNYLTIAPVKPYTIYGTIPTGSTGGSTSQVTWQQQIPIIPAFCKAIEYNITMAVSLTVASSSSVTLSPFAPYSAFSNQLTLGGAPPWPLTEITAWHIDEIKHKVDYDPYYVGLGNNTGYFGTNNVLTQGPTPQNIGGSGSLAPGATITTAGTTSYTFTFTVRQQLQRKRHILWGAVPFGDPENRPNNLFQLNNLVGTLPEQSLFVLNSGTATCSLSSQMTVYACYELSYIDLLYPGMSSAPAPMVGYGLQLSPSSPSGFSAGSLYPITHRTSQVYTAIDHILVNAGAPLQPDYFGLWDDQDQQSARWAFDAQANTFWKYYTDYHRRYRRYPYLGLLTAEFDDGEFPEVPSVTPLVSLMSPDSSYAQAFQIPVTPAMTTAIRVPTGTTLTNTYCRAYEWGLVKVPY